MSDNTTNLDMHTLDELRGLLDEGLDELLHEYLNDTPTQLSKLRAAADSGDMSALASVSHSLKGSSGNLGISLMFALCRDLEQQARSGSMTDAAGAVSSIEQAFDQAKGSIMAYMG